MENKAERSVWSVAITAVVVFLGLTFVSNLFVEPQQVSQAVESKAF